MDIFYDRDEWEDGTNESTWENEGGAAPSEIECEVGKIAIPQAEVYLEIHEGIPWDEDTIRISD